MKKKILIGAAVVLLGGGYVAKGYLMPPAKSHDKITGTVYILPKQFMVNLRDGRYATLNVALLLHPGQSDGSGGGDAATAPPEGYGTLPEEAVIRDLITGIVTDQTAGNLVATSSRERIKLKILLAIKSQTDVKVDDILFTDLAVQ